jgi:hypothetical protein
VVETELLHLTTHQEPFPLPQYCGTRSEATLWGFATVMNNSIITQIWLLHLQSFMNSHFHFIVASTLRQLKKLLIPQQGSVNGCSRMVAKVSPTST